MEKHPGVPAPKTYSSNLIERGRFFCDKIKKNLKTRSAWIIKVGLQTNDTLFIYLKREFVVVEFLLVEQLPEINQLEDKRCDPG